MSDPTTRSLHAQLFEGVTDADVAQALGYREAPPAGARRSGAVPEEPVPRWRDVLSQDAYEFIVRWETGGRAYYEKVIGGRPVWPGYSSGITVGCGFDLGYHTRADFLQQWSANLPKAALERLVQAVGFRTTDPGRSDKVVRAKELVQRLADIEIGWNVAITQFDEHKLPRLVGQLERALPNLDRLHPHGYGALLSLVFNRGAPFRSPDPRYAEMVEIHRLMAKGTVDAFAGVSAQLRSMKRIWGAESSLAKRREGEAQLFELGLRELQTGLLDS